MDEKLKVYEDKMKKTMANLEGEFGTIRAGRANPNVCLLYTSPSPRD